MEIKEKNGQEKNIKWLVFVLMAVGILVRLLGVSGLPGGMNQDEAYGAYDAFCIAHYGKDAFGYTMPVYMKFLWSGMSAFNTYVDVPFQWILGNTVLAMRLPHVIEGCFSLWVFYLLLRELFSKEVGLIGLFVLVINPWHIMMSRWALDCNYAPGLLLYSTYFFVKGLKKQKYLLLSALFYGFALYAYATVWLLVPIVLALSCIWALYTKRLRITGYTLGATGIVVAMAIPLLLFLLVNNGVIEEIRTPFLSIPRLSTFRGNEISFSQIPENFRALLKMLLTGYDGYPWNSVEEFGIFYSFSAPVLCLGLYGFFRDLKKKRMPGEAMPFVFWLVAGFFIALLYDANINRINYLILPVLVLLVYGIKVLGEYISIYGRNALILGYAIAFLSFSTYYFAEYKGAIGYHFGEGLEEALPVAMEQEGDIFVTDQGTYCKILYLLGYPQDKLEQSAQYTEDSFLHMASFDRFTFEHGVQDEMLSYPVVLDNGARRDELIVNGYEIVVVNDNWLVALRDQ